MQSTHSQHLQLTLQLASCSKGVWVTVATLILERKELSISEPLLMLFLGPEFGPGILLYYFISFAIITLF